MTIKRMTSFLLALLMVMNLCVPAYAAETTPALSLSVDKTEAVIGETVTVTISCDAEISGLQTWGFDLYLDPDAYVLTEAVVNDGYDGMFGVATDTITDHSCVNVSAITTNTKFPLTIPKGEVAVLTFTAVGESEGSFELKMVEAYIPDDEFSVTRLVGPAEGVQVVTKAEKEPEAPVASSVNVTLSLSSDDVYMVGKDTGEVMAFKEITVPYFDLALYGLEEYYFVSETYGDDGDGLPGSDLTPGTAEYAEGKVTLMHLYLYALEVFYCGIDVEDAGKGYLYNEGLIGTDVFNVSGGVGSSFMNQFWGGDCNLNYYVNYEYPLASDGWGATADQILLRDGDMVTLGHFSGWSFYADPYSIFNYIVSDKSTATQGEEVTLTLMYAGANLGFTDGTAQNLNTYGLDVYCVNVEELADPDVTSWNNLGTSDENGELVVNTADLAPGKYIVAVAGQYGVDFPDDICSTPGGVLLTVSEPKECAHNFVDGVCTKCSEPDPDYVAPANDYVFYTNESGLVMPGDYDIAITELNIADAKDKIIAVHVDHSGETNRTPLLATTTFLDATVKDGDAFTIGYKAVGDDADGVIVVPESIVIGEEWSGIAQNTLRIYNSTKANSIEVTYNFRIVTSFGLNKFEVTLNPAQEETLSVTTNLAKYLNTKLAECVEWTSSNTSVATVEGGKVVAVAPGTATITATVGTKSASCEVTVESNDAVVYEGELALNGNKDITITELILKGAKNKVLASYMGDYAGSWPLYVFLDGDKASAGETFEYDFAASGDDAADAQFRIISGYMGNTFTIQSYGYAMGNMQIQDSNGTTSLMFRSTIALVNQFNLNNSTLTLTPGNDATLSVNTGNGDVNGWIAPVVEWTSSDESVATVEGGRVVAVAPGTATITATVGTKTATCTVTVACDHDYFNGICTKCFGEDPDYVAIETIQLTSPSLKTETDETTGETVSVLELVAGGSEKLTAVLNEGATQGVIWTSENEGIATVNANGVVTAINNGTTTITATAGDTAKTFAARNNPVLASVKVTVTSLPEGEYYTVTLAEDKTVVAGETIEIPVTVGHSDHLRYNAWDMIFTYDSSSLKLTTESTGETFTVTTDGNTIRVQGYGADMEADSVAFTLTFEALKAATSELSLDSALVDNAGHAIGNDAPEAQVIDGLTVLTVTGYPVTLPEGFQGEGVAAPGKNYTFSAPQDYYDYTVEIQVAGETVTVEGVDGTWTIPGASVTGEIVITQTDKTGKTFTVALGDYMSGEATAQHGTPYSATLNKEAGYTYSVTVKIGDEVYTGAEVSR